MIVVIGSVTAQQGRHTEAPRLVTAVLALAACLLAGCATWKPGEDPNGVEARDATRPVLAALVKYKKERGEYPTSLHELAPHYINEVPFNPGLQYSRESGSLGFAYFPSWPLQAPIACGAKLGELDWTCGE